MKSAIKSKQTPRHAAFTVPLEVSPNMTIGVKGYVMYKRQQLSRASYIYTKSSKPKIAKSVAKSVVAVSFFS